MLIRAERLKQKVESVGRTISCERFGRMPVARIVDVKLATIFGEFQKTINRSLSRICPLKELFPDICKRTYHGTNKGRKDKFAKAGTREVACGWFPL
jgi:hypothetical protein